MLSKLVAAAAVALAVLASSIALSAVTAQEPAVVKSDCVGCPSLVMLPDGSAIGQYLVTKDEFAVFATETGFDSSGGCVQRFDNAWGMNDKADWTAPGFAQAGDHPVVCVSWVDATAYVGWLADKTGKPYRLPTLEESQAAYAAGSKGVYSWGDDVTQLCQHANVADASYKRQFPDDDMSLFACDDGFAFTSPVSAFPPNAYGLYDAVGNVWQWTNSCLMGDCANAIFRGGGWNVPNAEFFQVAGSFGDRILLRNFVIGFRVFRDPD